MQKPKRLWHARVDYRHPGKWLATQEFMLGKPYKPEIPMKYKCHVLYESAMEAFLSIKDKIQEAVKNSGGATVRVYIYSVKLQLITSANYFPPEKTEDLELYSHDREFFRRHLIRQSLNFERAANLQICTNRYSKLPIKQITYTNSVGETVPLLECRLPTVEMTYGVWSKYMCQSIESSIFNFDEFPFLRPVTVKNLEAA